MLLVTENLTTPFKKSMISYLDQVSQTKSLLCLCKGKTPVPSSRKTSLRTNIFMKCHIQYINVRMTFERFKNYQTLQLMIFHMII